MIEADYGTFERAFKRVYGAFRLKLKAAEAKDLTTTYFRLLSDHAIDVVLVAGKTWMQANGRMPTAADWIGEILSATRPAAPSDHRQLTVEELAEASYAELLRYVGAPCTCHECVTAGVDLQPMRYVPNEVGSDDYERVYNPRRGMVQIAGHWSHGEELRRWYAARDAFYALAATHPYALHLVAREPGEEG